MSATRTEPAVWLLWTGEGETRGIYDVFGSRDAACHKLCDLVLRGKELDYPKITRQPVKDAGPVNSTNQDPLAAVISAVRGMNATQKSDIRRATLARLWAALEVLAYPATASVDALDAPFHPLSPDGVS
jgi:hypothetical protein